MDQYMKLSSKRASQQHKATEKQVGFYLRVSTEEQAENPEGSIKNQEERLKLTLALKNTDGKFGTLAGVYCDAGRSGKDMNRPELKRLLKAIEAGEINMVMVSELSRLSRSIKDFSQIWEFMQAHGCGFLSLRENFDTSTAAGEMMLYSIANFAQFERRQTSERVAAGFLSRAQRGLWNGGPLPLGYEPDPEKKGNLRIVEDEADVVRVAFQALLSHGSVPFAAKWLNDNGYSPYGPLRGGGYLPRRRHFTTASLYRLLRNSAYAGRRIVKARTGNVVQVVPAAWPCIIEERLFDRAQKVLDAGKGQKTGRGSRYPYLLSTRITCGQCGAPLIGNSAHGRTTKVPYYGHGSQLRREDSLGTKGPRCNPFRIPGRKLEERVWKEVVSLIESPSHREPLFQAIQGLTQIHPSKNGEVARKEIDLTVTAQKLANLAKRIAELPPEVPAEVFYDEMKSLAENQGRLKLQLQGAKLRAGEQRLAGREDYERILETLRNQLTDLTPETKRRIIHALIHKVVITNTGFELHYFAGVDQKSHQTKKGEAFASPAFSLNKKNYLPSSFKGLNGSGDWG
ncbi:MAG TPA: hypothetical protein DCS07_00085 [Bdellovibrionales bacterium]|nr:hypothetical protein [Bdellovibrionales bacterium]HCM40438.1 hypothetical protein [Bdellovibrionales bacterium]